MSEKNETRKTEETATLQPRVDVLEDTGGITLRADLPGVPKDRIAIDVDGDTLRIEGDIVVDTPEGMEPTWAEVRVARYRRAFALSPELDTGTITAEFRDGVLKLRIPKHAHAQPRRIEVQAA
ncbi:Hsp20/alpha crystallin family protein [Pseudazoarcus pumilus]|uniref:Heat-shock protein n=1 Tax=Pseudazoarcus pumilus TaxID=2067960 RepID=A0A2I6S2Q4_9RHOO|nr:Hsp20/alpha crystallin family protein [Pseudazoarcus pumilus]AUN93497.1 heat-shock protein [Pseudazoarcus pumilus]